jgi:hypothetical protein
VPLTVPQIWAETHARVRPQPSEASLAHLSLEVGATAQGSIEAPAFVATTDFENGRASARLSFSSDRLLKAGPGVLALGGSLGLMAYEREGDVDLNGRPLRAQQSLFVLPMLLGARYVPDFARREWGHAGLSLSGGPLYAIAPASQVGPSYDQWGAQAQLALQGLVQIPQSSFGVTATAAGIWGGFAKKGFGYALGAGFALLL